MATTATVKVTLEIKADSTWGDDCTVGQVKKQAIDSARKIIGKALDKSPNNIDLIGQIECINIKYTA